MTPGGEAMLRALCLTMQGSRSSDVRGLAPMVGAVLVAEGCLEASEVASASTTPRTASKSTDRVKDFRRRNAETPSETPDETSSETSKLNGGSGGSRFSVSSIKSLQEREGRARGRPTKRRNAR